MPSNFSSLRASRATALDRLNKELEKEQSGKTDDRFWKLTIDPKTKLGYAVIRFLPAPVNEEQEWVRLYSHSFKIGQNWFIENCPTTHGQVSCPVCKSNSALWQTDIESNKKIASTRKRKLSYISNILVVNDPAHPENNGKVFLFRYGVKIWEKLQEYMNPKFPDAEPGNPFDMWDGSDFKLKSTAQGDFASYEKSEFAAKSSLFGDDDAKKEEIWKQEHALQPLVASNQIKSYEDLEARFNRVVTGIETPATAAEAIKDTATVADAKAVAAAVDKPRKRATKPTPTVAPTEPSGADEEDLRDFFKDVLDE